MSARVMLVFIDEAGDPGFKFDSAKNQHSSRFFTVGMVIFEDNEEANVCDQTIQLLKKKLGKPPHYEFHYTKDSDKIKEAFFREISPYNFFYYGIVIDKQQLYSDNFRIKDTFFKYTTGLVFENAKERLDDAIIIFDTHGGADFEHSFKKYLKSKFNDNAKKRIKQVKMQKSHQNNLLQLADYIASGVHHSLTKHRDNHYIDPIRHRAIYVQKRPKQKPTSSLEDKPC